MEDEHRFVCRMLCDRARAEDVLTSLVASRDTLRILVATDNHLVSESADQMSVSVLASATVRLSSVCRAYGKRTRFAKTIRLLRLRKSFSMRKSKQ